MPEPVGFPFFKLSPLAFLVLISGISAWLYLCYRWVLPRPIPGIPYNEEATKTILGDMGSMVRHMGKTKELYDWIMSQNAML